MFFFNFIQGDTSSSPELEYVSEGGCALSINWYSAYACPLKQVTGENCMVTDQSTGATIDLNKLKRNTDDPYQVDCLVKCSFNKERNATCFHEA